LLILQAARASGCSRIFVTDVDATRIKLARSLGADAVIQGSVTDSSDESLTSRIEQLTNGRGVDVTFEAVGRPETVAAAIDCTRKGGTVALVGNISPEVAIPLQKVVTRQIRLQGSCASAGEYPQAMEWIAAGKIKVAPLITAIAPLEDGPSWFARLYAREPNLMKVVLDPRSGQNQEVAPA
jgi:L-iditol 2-dehydrogenase